MIRNLSTKKEKNKRNILLLRFVSNRPLSPWNPCCVTLVIFEKKIDEESTQRLFSRVNPETSPPSPPSLPVWGCTHGFNYFSRVPLHSLQISSARGNHFAITVFSFRPLPSLSLSRARALLPHSHRQRFPLANVFIFFIIF